jgi:hypothetical protein
MHHHSIDVEESVVKPNGYGLCRFILACWVIALCLEGQANAVTVTLEASQDNTLYEDSAGTLSNGAGEHFFVGRVGTTGGQTLRRGLIRFDVMPLIPPGATINSVELSLNASSQRGSNTGMVSLHSVLVPWGEGSSAALSSEGMGTASTDGDATWIHTHFDFAFWTNPGGDFEPQSSGSVAVASNGAQVITSTPDMVSDVQGWLDNPASNHGWLLRQVDETAAAIRFDTREHADPSVQPRLTIDFSLPPMLISPPSGIYALTQVMDAVAFFNLPQGIIPTDAEVLLDGVDASADFSSCFLSVPGTVPEGGQTVRCPELSAADIGAGMHTFEVILNLSDGSSLQQSVTWLIIANTEP